MSMDNCNCDGYVNSIYTVAVSSTTDREVVPSYSEPCAAALTTTYSGGEGKQRIVSVFHNTAYKHILAYYLILFLFIPHVAYIY